MAQQSLFGKTERRLAAAILLTAIVPLAAALLLANSLFAQAAAIWFNPEIGQQLDRGVDVYKDYVKAIKDDMRHQTDAITADAALRSAARKHDADATRAALDLLFPQFPELVALSVEGPDGAIVRHDRGRAVDTARERSLDVRKPLDESDDAPQVVATFAIDRKRLDELETTGNVVAKYHQLETSRAQLYQSYYYAFAVLLVFTLLLTVMLGTILARGVTRRINRLATAINRVTEGDMTVRVPVTGSDELTDLARVFNRMLGEMEQSRARIEFLQRIGAWQEIAQRLAHEIKNPLTPIQLAVQECHRKYNGDDVRFRGLLDTTLEIVEEEVGTLRRLVGNFSSFARLPHAELNEASLRDFLEECSEQFAHLEDAGDGLSHAHEEGSFSLQDIEIAWELPNDPLVVAFDRQMLRRVLINLVRNAAQAIRNARGSQARSEGKGRIVVSAQREGDGAIVRVEDAGPGISLDVLPRIFEPYFTTKADGTGLGLAIAKKILVEHGGEIEASASTRLGGACFVLTFPDPRVLALATARERASRARLSGPDVSASASEPSA